MLCPGCNGELTHHDYKHNGFIGIDRCDKCHGCWLDHAELEQLEAGVFADVDALGVDLADALADIQCPKCAAQMVSFTLQDQVSMRFDRCPACHGLWLDSGELSQLQRVLDDYAEEHGKPLVDRPENWSLIHWVAYRVLTFSNSHITVRDGSGWV